MHDLHEILIGSRRDLLLMYPSSRHTQINFKDVKNCQIKSRVMDVISAPPGRVSILVGYADSKADELA